MTVRFSGAVAHRVASGSANLYVETSGDGSPLLLVHGWPLDMRIFTPQVPAFSRRHRVIVYDRRGFGRSTGEQGSPGEPGLARELDDIDRITAELAAEPVHLLGMSQGGRIALRYAATRPERLHSLILQGPVVDGLAVEETDDERIPLARYAELARRGRLDEVREHWLRHPMMAIGQPCARELLDSIVQDYRGTDLERYTAAGYGFPIDVMGALPKLTLPILILSGATETAARRAHAAALLRLVPGAREVVLERSGHLCNLTEPDTYNREVLGFLAEVDGD